MSGTKLTDDTVSSHKSKRALVMIIVCLSVSMAFLVVHSGAGLTITSSSWNSSVNCTPTVVTLESLMGSIPNPSQTAPAQGADYSGGAFRLAGTFLPGNDPSSTLWPFSKRSLTPPCTATNADGLVVGNLVEIHDLKVMSTGHDECGSVFPNICDDTVNLCNNLLAPNCVNSFPDTMHEIHSEIDMYWNHAGTAPTQPAYGTMIDVQGFIFWDDGHTILSWHHYSGWELHPLTAWRLAGSGPPPPPPPGPLSTSFTYGPASPIIGQTVTFAGTSSGGTSPYSFSWNFGDNSQGSGTTVTHSYNSAGTYNVGLTSTDSAGATASSTRPVTVAVSSIDFSISVAQSSLSVRQGASRSDLVTITEHGGSSGTVNLSVQVSPSGLNSVNNPSTVSLQSGTASSILTVSSSRATPTGVYTVTILGTMGGISHSVTVTVLVRHR